MNAHCVLTSHQFNNHAWLQCQQKTSRISTTLPPSSRRNKLGISKINATAEADVDKSSPPSSFIDKLLKAPTVPTRILSSQETIDALYSAQHEFQRDSFCAFYSSELGGIVTDPALMIVQIDDHMVHRGHAVFDTAILEKGHIYQLGKHVERFLSSAAKANIPLPPRTSPEQFVRIILETVASSRQLDGHVRFFLSAGRGGFSLSGNDCIRSSLYVIVYKRDENEADSELHLHGWKVKTSPVPIKAPFFANLKSTDYLPNALNVMDAESEGFNQGIFLDSNGNVAEGPNMNIGIIHHDGTLIIPPFDASLAGITVQRLLELISIAIDKQVLDGVSRIERRHFNVSEAVSAREAFLVGGSLPIMSIIQWDDRAIGDGAVGISVLQLRALLLSDMVPGPESNQHVEVPYGYLTGMDA